MIAPKPISRPDRVSLWRYLQLFRQDILSAQPERLYSALMAEFHPLFIFRHFDSDRPVPRFSPYVVAGVGYYHFEPQAKLNNVWVSLQPLHLEGEGFSEYPDVPNYNLTQVCIPLGGGLRYELSRLFVVRLEVVYRVLSTDYLDDAHSLYYIDPSTFRNHLTGSSLSNALLLYDRRDRSNPVNAGVGQRANPNNKDGYLTFNLKLGLTFGRERMTNASGRRK